ncbi:protein of unknown function [Pseudomonas sp. JV551A1]|uniref:Uncharacterized protein n=1 Tax=Pseudomonas inefficax TaxID=2078786 RepID=A0AAQ1PAR1_9PSED|nr:protein of unknown function [Pseudomonas sp. JV551A1]SPO62391.1 protein of unknown function [Pseudomonas inefficax]
MRWGRGEGSMARVKSRVNLFGFFAGEPAPTGIAQVLKAVWPLVGAGSPAKRPAQAIKIGNFLHIHETAGTIRYICCHTCAKTQHKPLSQKTMRAQIAGIRKSPPLKLLTACRHGSGRAVMLKVVVHWPHRRPITIGRAARAGIDAF